MITVTTWMRWTYRDLDVDFDCTRRPHSHHAPMLTEIVSGNFIEASLCSGCSRPIMRPSPGNQDYPLAAGEAWRWAAWDEAWTPHRIQPYVIQEEP